MPIVPLIASTGEVVAHAEADEADLPLVAGYTWRLFWRRDGLRGHRYAVRWDGKRPVLMHRSLVSCPAGMEVDHVDGDGLNNRRSNLRVVTHAQNMQNKRATLSGATSRYRAVHLNGQTGRWRARAKLNGKDIHIGYFATEDEAAAAAAAWRRRNLPYAVEASA